MFRGPGPRIPHEVVAGQDRCGAALLRFERPLPLEAADVQHLLALEVNLRECFHDLRIRRTEVAWGGDAPTQIHRVEPLVACHLPEQASFVLILPPLSLPPSNPCQVYLRRLPRGCCTHAGSSSRNASAAWPRPTDSAAVDPPKSRDTAFEPGTTRNGEERVVYLTSRSRSSSPHALQRETSAIVPLVFPHLAALHRGQEIGAFGKARKTVGKAAGVAGRLFHDPPRTAVRNMERTGWARSVATKMTRYKTESAYWRYAIVSDADLQEAAL
jgi:hypothetical protein